ncbi:hypothetical protein TTHT_0605 [Thermotomaculum hydrothermale]|uniref:HD-GYP domain-containing protein n=1 Tax=Thermotomaculum hydrothermale TaxID=981385 RepID=A0A7R6PT71_9BACT|nr:HD domain-containing phosphohydrolase [Thermotomaculum hydrothermale]BBB32187.1 hypothetical protein TTHT_0605 [Thermotomaculum hydrothermale]
MKKIKLGKSKNIKTLSKRDFELYSQKSPFLIDSIFKEVYRDLKKGFFNREVFRRYLGNFYLAGDFLSSIILARRIATELFESLSEEDLSIVYSALALLFSFSGDTEISMRYISLISDLKKTDKDIAYRWFSIASMLNDYDNGNYLSSYLNGKRIITAISGLDSSHGVFTFQPKFHLLGILTRVTNRSAQKLAQNEKVGSEKRKRYFDTMLEILKEIKKMDSKPFDFFYYCELANLHSSMHSFPKAEKALNSAFDLIKASKKAFNKYSYIYYLTKANYFTQKGDFSEAYKQIKLAYRASFNVSDVYDELDVINIFLETARQFSISDPSLRQQTSEFYMQGNSLLKQFVNFLEEKDWYTGKNHSAKVAGLSHLIAKKLVTVFPYMKNFIDIQSVYLAGYVHDIGKVKIPWLLINKITKLEEFEVDYLMKHVVFGRDILEDLNFYSIARIIYQHHESPDGAGYPEGIKNVSVEANIISLADSFEAMTTSNRKYKKPKSLETAKEEIISLAGSKYYPEIIESFKMISSEELKTFLSRLK